eukprot:PhF_6_TR4476/c0_g1_i2/m.6137/K07759/PARG; poly(ADP-ribose) glycohydrolase
MDGTELPFANEAQWSRTCAILQQPLTSWSTLDNIINELTPPDATDRKCKFFSMFEKDSECGDELREDVWKYGIPFMIRTAVDAPLHFPTPSLPFMESAKKTTTSSSSTSFSASDVHTQQVELTRTQVACVIALSALGVFCGRVSGKERYRFRVHQIFTLQATQSALCVLNYFTVLGKHGVPPVGTLVYERLSLPKSVAANASIWENSTAPLCEVVFAPPEQTMEENKDANVHVDFANMQVGGGTLTGDCGQEELLFNTKPELFVAIVLNAFLRDEDVVTVHGALQFSAVSGFRSEYRFVGSIPPESFQQTPPSVLIMDALDLRVGLKPRQFELPFLRRDLAKGLLGYSRWKSSTVATGHWGCGAFGHDHFIKFFQQWMSCSEAGVKTMVYHTLGERKGEGVEELWKAVQVWETKSVGQVWQV